MARENIKLFNWLVNTKGVPRKKAAEIANNKYPDCAPIEIGAGLTKGKTREQYTQELIKMGFKKDIAVKMAIKKYKRIGKLIESKRAVNEQRRREWLEENKPEYFIDPEFFDQLDNAIDRDRD